MASSRRRASSTFWSQTWVLIVADATAFTRMPSESDQLTPSARLSLSR